jgi:hypothetical protein
MNENNEFRAVIGERNICTSYYAGMLQGTLRTLCWRDAPGLTITDPKAFRAWVERELESCMVEAEIYQMTKDKKKGVSLTPTEIADVESSMDAIYKQSAKVPYKPLDTEPMV